nr:hypothetical protein GCM10017745_59260 [Saccharothrix mutabilis subsp. capreolus]
MVKIELMRTRRFAGLTGGLALVALVAAHGIGVADATDRPEPPGVTAWTAEKVSDRHPTAEEAKGEPTTSTTTTDSTTTTTDTTTTTTATTTTTSTTGTPSETTTTTTTTTTPLESTTTRFPPLGFSKVRDHPPGALHQTAALANTGFTPGTFLLVGGLLLIAGTALLALAARRRA